MNDKAPLKILYVEDEPALRERIKIVLEMNFRDVITASNGERGLAAFAASAPDIIVTDIKMPGLDGIGMVRRIKETAPNIPVLLTTAFTETDLLMKAIELGVSSYVRKPLDCRQLVDTINRIAAPVLQKKELDQEKSRSHASMGVLLGDSPAMRTIIQQAQLISETDFSVLITGETGVGKSYLARLIHQLGRRKQAPFVTASLGSMPESLVENQLFGHRAGAFTGAVATSKGLLEAANSGTVFLDDIDCASPATQAKILHVVEHKSFFPIGSTTKVDADVRVISASNCNFIEAMQAGRFRSDLYYRLNETVISLPPLRERGEDIGTFARKFLHDASSELGKPTPSISPEALLELHRHPWPGNLRELRSVMKRAALFGNDLISGTDMSRLLSGSSDAPAANGDVHSLHAVKRRAIEQALASTGGRKMEAASLLGVNYSSFKRMLVKYGL